MNPLHVRRSVRLWSLALSASVAAGSWHGPLFAQQVPQQAPPHAPASVVAIQPRNATDGRDEGVFARRVSVQLERASLRQAMNALAGATDVRIQFQNEVLDAVGRRVTISLSQQPLRVALDRVLAGTNLQAIVLGDDAIAIVRTARDEAIQEPVVGKVVNAATKQPLSGVTVTLDDATQGVLTREDGTFRIMASAGQHRVVARLVGFMKQEQRVVVEEGRSVIVEFQLKASASVLDEVVVTGTVVPTERKAIPTPITVITAEELEKRNITRVEELFRGQVPGILAAERGTTSYTQTLGGMAASTIYSRGSASLDGSANPIKTYVDGVEIADPSYLGTLDTRSIERIEIITGPQAATVYGSGAMGGVMQIFTKRGSASRKPVATLSLKYGMLRNNFSDATTPSHDHGLTLTGGTGAEFTYSVNGSYTYTGQWQPGLYNRRFGGQLGATYASGPATVSGSYATSYGSNGTAANGGTEYGQIFGGPAVGYPSIWDQVLAQDGDARPRSNAGTFSQRISTASTQTVGLNVDYRMTRIWQQHVTVGRNQNAFALTPTAPGFTSRVDTLFRLNGSNTQRTTLGYNMTFAPRTAHVSSTLTVGANGSWGAMAQTSGCVATSVATSYVPCDIENIPAVTRSVDDRNWGGFGSWQLGFFDKLFVTTAIRGERNPTYGSEHAVDWTPTQGVTYTVERGDLTLKLLASYGSATRPPALAQRMLQYTSLPGFEPNEYVSQWASPDLKPEHSRGPQGGFELYYGNLGSLTINRYQQTVTDLIQAIIVDRTHVRSTIDGWEFDAEVYQQQNTGTIRQDGWESTASLNLGPVSARGTYSWNRSYVRSVNPQAGNPSGGSFYREGQTFNNLPSHTGNFMVGYARGGTSITWVTNYVGAQTQRGGRELNWIVWGASRIRTYVPNLGRGPTWFSAPGYAKSNLNLSQRLTTWATATVNVNNVSNAFNSETTALFPSLGRQTLIGVSLRSPTR